MSVTVTAVVELRAFPCDVEERRVEIPSEDWEAAKTEMDRLELIFRLGQNDFQPVEGCYSVSAGDVIRLPFTTKRYLVEWCGFKRLD